MIVCHCANICSDDINAAIEWMRASDIDIVITPGRVYRALGKKADCGSCLSLFLSIMQANEKTGVPVELQNLNRQRKGKTNG
jgi:bacterioferritin-associated ferredoxin